MFAGTETAPDPVEDVVARPQTVLLIDDDVDQTQALAWRLQTQGFETRIANSGRHGLQLAQTERPSVILLDLQLPDIDGLTVCSQLSDGAATCCIPVIILSAADRPSIVRQARAAGCDYYLRKPYDPNVVLMLVENAIAGDGA